MLAKSSYKVHLMISHIYCCIPIFKGLLDSIELKITKQDDFIVKVYWDPPFTLQGISILGYNINITNINTGNLLSQFIQTTSIQVAIVDDYNYNISIAAVNGAGEGNKSLIFINSTDLKEGKRRNVFLYPYKIMASCR